MEATRLEAFVEHALRKALALGASEAEVYAVESRERSVSVSRGVFDVPRAGSTLGLSLRVSCGNRASVAGGVVSSLSEVDSIAEHAVSMCRAQPEDRSWRGLPRGLSSAKTRGVYDKTLAELTVTDLAEIAGEVSRKIGEKSRGRVQPARGTVASSTTKRVVANTSGERVAEESTRLTLVFEGVARDSQVEAAYFNHAIARRLSDLDIEDFANIIAERALAGLRRVKVESGLYEAILAPKVSASVFDALLSPAVSALSIQRRRSPLAGRVGEQVFSEMITVVDDGTLEAMAGSRGFDDEGIAVRGKLVFEKGVFKTPLYDTRTARLEGVESTGNAVRARLSSMPEPGVINLVVQPGTSPLESLVSEMRRGFVVYGVIGEWLSDYTRGYLNATIVNADYVENGEVKGSIVNGVVTGDFYAMLRGKLRAASRELGNSGVIYAPAMFIEEVRIAV